MFNIAFCGHGRAGKDTAGAFLGACSDLRYVGSLSEIVCPLIAKDLGQTSEQAWNERHANRAYWKAWCDAYRSEDPARLVKESLKKGEIVVGIRDKIEIDAAREAGIVQLFVWIHNHRVPIDPTVTYQPQDCDIALHNDGTLAHLGQKIRTLARALGLYNRRSYDLEVAAVCQQPALC